MLKRIRVFFHDVVDPNLTNNCHRLSLSYITLTSGGTLRMIKVISYVLNCPESLVPQYCF